MKQILPLAVGILLAISAHAQEVFESDPLCESVDGIRKAFDQARPLHLKHPLLRSSANDQSKWFVSLTKSMSSVCEADKRFAASLVAAKKQDFSGQCKPAAEAAMFDKQVLEHSEASLRLVKAMKDEFLTKGKRGESDPLVSIFTRENDVLNKYMFGTMDIPYQAECEVKWVYPAALYKTMPPIEGCADPEFFAKPAERNQKDAAVFGQLLTTLDASITYNMERRSHAFATAQASQAKYDACVAQFPDEAGQQKLVRGGAKGASAPKGNLKGGKAPHTGSDITGIEEDKAKQKKER